MNRRCLDVCKEDGQCRLMLRNPLTAKLGQVFLKLGQRLQGRDAEVGNSLRRDSEEEFRELTLALASELQLRPLLRKIMDAATRLLDADRSTLFLHDDETGELWSPVAQGMDGQEIRFPCNLGIAGAVFRSGKSISIADAYADSRFNRAMDQATGYRTHTILCCPVVNKEGVVIGAIQTLNKSEGPFSERDAERLTAFAAQASLAIENAKLYDNLEETVRERTRDLHETLELLYSELDLAAGYVKRLIPKPLDEGDLATDWRFMPSVGLGGDAFGYHWLDPDHFAVYLTDVSGHGVGAALLSVSITNVLRSHTLPGVDFRDPVQVLAGLNQSFPMEEHYNMFFTMWYGVYNREKGILTYSSGGHPPALLVSDSEVRDLSTGGPVMGVLAATGFTRDQISIAPSDRLLVYSDGCYEITKQDGEMWRLSEFRDFMAEAPGLDALVDYTRKIGKSEEYEDDFSIFEVVFR